MKNYWFIYLRLRHPNLQIKDLNADNKYNKIEEKEDFKLLNGAKVIQPWALFPK